MRRQLHARREPRALVRVHPAGTSFRVPLGFAEPGCTRHGEELGDVLRELGHRLHELRRARGLTQEALAEALDLSVAYVSLIERGGRNPPYTTVVAIARALGASITQVCGDD